MTQHQEQRFHRFIFCNFWTLDPQYHDIVAEMWNQNIDGIPMFIITQKLKILKQKFRGLHKSKYSSMKGRLKAAKEELDEIQSQLQQHMGYVQLKKMEKDCSERYKSLANVELSLYKQKLKEDWTKEMDRNSAYFHTRVNEKQARSMISSISDNNGNIVEEESQIADLFVQYYENLFGTAAQSLQPVDMSILTRGPILTEQQKLQLCAEVTEEEIHRAVFSIDKDKSPGPDGFGSGFFQSILEHCSRGSFYGSKGFLHNRKDPQTG